MKTDDILFDVEVPGSSLERIALFSEATEDPNPIHVDRAFAQAAGFAEVIQQGPMTTAHLARLLEQHIGQHRLVWLDLSFVAPVFPMEPLRMVARVEEVSAGQAHLALTVAKRDGTVTARGQAHIQERA